MTHLRSDTEIYTDGSCFPNPGHGGWAFVVVRDGRCIKESFGGEPDTTSCRMELTGILQGLRWLPPGSSATVVSDSEYALKVLSGEHRARANLDLIERAWALIQERDVTFRWVRGHAGDRWNEHADALAARGMARGNRKKRKKLWRRMKKAANNADLRRRAEQDGLCFEDSLPDHLIP